MADIQDYEFLHTLSDGRIKNIIENAKSIIKIRQKDELANKEVGVDKNDVFIFKADYESLGDWQEGSNKSLFFYDGLWVNDFGYSGFKFYNIFSDETESVDELDDIVKVGKLIDNKMIWNEDCLDIKSHFVKLLGL